ncbi:unnamed protein product [Porites lobata]|uniref:Uncharacterized protein n=1 Tax=Porites lobata TaxID=104759 RepID=A0ABN8R9M2_9CNID|nr:unnamed protein product [Porites lobata]
MISPFECASVAAKLSLEEEIDLHLPEKLLQSYISWVIRLYKLGDKTVRAGPEDCWNSTASFDVTDNSMESRPAKNTGKAYDLKMAAAKKKGPPSFTTKQRSSFVLVLQEKCEEPTNKTALGQFRFGFLAAGWFVPPRS